MSIYVVKVRGGVHNMPSNPMESGDFEIDLTGSVGIEAKDEASAREGALDVLHNEEEGSLLTLSCGDGVEFEVVSVELAPAAVNS